LLNLFSRFVSPADLATLKWGYKRSRELARRLGLYRGEFLPGNPKFPEGSEALCSASTTGPVDDSTPDIVYTSEDDKAIDDYHRNYGEFFLTQPLVAVTDQ